MRSLIVVVSVAACAVFCSSCQSSEGGVVNKVMSDFGLKQKPEGYVSDSDKAMERLNAAGLMEMKRLNQLELKGTIKFQPAGELHGKYYKEVKVYESFYPTDAQAVSRTSDMERGFYGYIEYAFRMYQSARKDTSAEASILTADVPTEVTGRERYRYMLNAGGEWNGGKGERVRK
jgi:hypothetical protein